MNNSWGEPERAPHKRFVNVRYIYVYGTSVTSVTRILYYAQGGSMDINTKYSTTHPHAWDIRAVYEPF